MISNGNICCGIDYFKDVIVGALKLFFDIGLNILSNQNIQNCAPSGNRYDKSRYKKEKKFRSYSEIVEKR